MDVEKVFHMKGGLGETSYFKNSSFQKNVAERMKEITLGSIKETYVTLKPKSLGIAELGCSSGSNSLFYIKSLVRAVEEASQDIEVPEPEFRVCLNDLPTNDFNTMFQALPDLYEEFNKGRKNGAPSVYVAAYPGNFYGRLFPNNSLHFVYSFSCLHWLSRVPPGIFNEKGASLNKKSIYLSRNSPPQVCEAYAKQFKEDFSLFLKSRSQELVSGGRMVLVLIGRSGPDIFSRDSTFLWEVLYQAFCTLVTKGIVEEEKLNSYDVHYYGPSKEEIEHEVSKEGSFELEHLETLEKEMDSTTSGMAVAKSIRAVQESLVAYHFGEAILDDLFDEYGRLLDREMTQQAASNVRNGYRGCFVKFRKCSCDPTKYFDIKVSGSRNNPGRAYYKCAKCGDFDWVFEADLMRSNTDGGDEGAATAILQAKVDELAKRGAFVVKMVVVLYLVLVISVLLKK